MDTYILLAGLAAVMFGLGAILGAPFVPTRRAVAEEAIGLLGLKRGQLLLDLGSGSGTVLAAAGRRGLRAIGYEVNPLLYLWSKLRVARFGNRVKVRLADYWHQDLPSTDGIYVFLIGRYMEQLHHKLNIEIKRPTKVVSYAFKIPGKREIKAKDGLYLYNYYPNKETEENLLALQSEGPAASKP